MKLLSRIVTVGFALLLLQAALITPAQAQLLPPPTPTPGRPKVVMENVFFNVVWGSALGATLGVASSILSSSDPSAPSSVREGAFTGATAGGLIGLGLALYLVYQGITFDQQLSSFSTLTGSVDPSQQRPRGGVEPSSPPFVLLTSSEHPGRVTGFSARVFELRF